MMSDRHVLTVTHDVRYLIIVLSNCIFSHFCFWPISG
jgi:hypothetical protein